jgi:hypothetical protein
MVPVLAVIRVTSLVKNRRGWVVRALPIRPVIGLALQDTVPVFIFQEWCGAVSVKHVEFGVTGPGIPLGVDRHVGLGPAHSAVVGCP